MKKKIDIHRAYLSINTIKISQLLETIQELQVLLEPTKKELNSLKKTAEYSQKKREATTEIRLQVVPRFFREEDLEEIITKIENVQVLAKRLSSFWGNQIKPVVNNLRRVKTIYRM